MKVTISNSGFSILGLSSSELAVIQTALELSRYEDQIALGKELRESLNKAPYRRPKPAKYERPAGEVCI